ncbi:MAG: glycosyltransferase family 2 protein [Ferruginibacter sp.]
MIVNYNVKYFLEQCLCSVVKACKNINAEIFVVDNNSTDGSKDFFTSRFPGVRFIWKNENAGFAKANNEALQQASGEKILFLNPDTIVPEDCFEKCLSFLSTKDQAGAMGVYMIDGGGRYLPESKRGFPSLFTSFCKMSGLTALFPKSKLFARYYLGHLQENEVSEVDVLSGAFLMVDRKLLDNIGGFDERFFMYAEDIDLSYRIQQAGYKNYYYPGTSIIHFKGESTQKQNPDYAKHFYGTMILFIKKHYHNVVAGLYILLLRMAIALKSLFANKPTSATGKIYYDKIWIFADANKVGALRHAMKQYATEIIITRALDYSVDNGNAVVFCESSITFKEIIGSIQKHKGQRDFFIHAENTNSIIGSNNKNSSGAVIQL